MKRILILLVVLTLVSVLVAEVNISGKMRTRMALYNNAGWNEDINDFDMNSASLIDSRIRLKIATMMSENLKGNFQFEMGDFHWGDDDAANLSTDGVIVELKHANIMYMCPKTGMDVTLGLQYLASPHSLVLDDDLAGIIASKNMGELDFKVGFAKLDEDLNNLVGTDDFEGDDDRDLFIVGADMKDIGAGMDLYYDRKADTNYKMYLMPYYTNSFGAVSVDASLAYEMGNNEDALVDQNGVGSDVSTSAYALSLKLGYETNAKFGFNMLYTSADDDTGDEEITSFSAISPYYMNGLELFGYGINDGIQKGWAGAWTTGYTPYGSMDFVFTADFPLSKKLSVNGAFGMLNTIEGDETAVAMEFDAGMSCKIYDNLSLKSVAAFAMPNEDFFGYDDMLFEIGTVLKYTFK